MTLRRTFEEYGIGYTGARLVVCQVSSFLSENLYSTREERITDVKGEVLLSVGTIQSSTELRSYWMAEVPRGLLRYRSFFLLYPIWTKYTPYSVLTVERLL